MEKEIPCNCNQKRRGVAILISDKIDLQSIGQRQRSLYNNKGTIQQENIIIVNIYAPNFGTPIYLNKY